MIESFLKTLWTFKNDYNMKGLRTKGLQILCIHEWTLHFPKFVHCTILTPNPILGKSFSVFSNNVQKKNLLRIMKFILYLNINKVLKTYYENITKIFFKYFKF